MFEFGAPLTDTRIDARRIVDAAGLEVVGLSDAGRQRQHALKAPAVDRQVLQLLAGRLRLHGGGFGLQQHGIGRHQHRFLKRADVSFASTRTAVFSRTAMSLRPEGLEPRQRDIDAIGARGDVRERVAAGFVASSSRATGWSRRA